MNPASRRVLSRRGPRSSAASRLFRKGPRVLPVLGTIVMCLFLKQIPPTGHAGGGGGGGGEHALSVIPGPSPTRNV